MIRPAILADLPGVLALHRHLHSEDPEVDDATAQARWTSLLASGVVTVVVADAAGILASSCALAIIPNMSRRMRLYGVIENVVTHPGHRRAGLGRAVLQAAITLAWEAGCYKVMLATGSREDATLRFYEGAGFHRGGKTYFEARRP